MNTAETLLVEFLEELSSEELQEFLCCLQSEKRLKADEALPVVKFMIDTFGSEKAVTSTISILRDIKQKQLASQLQALRGQLQ